MKDAATVLIGCGILKKETLFLIEKNNWQTQSQFACSSLHTNFNALMTAVVKMLDCYPNADAIVLYGTCHPLLDRVLAARGARRMPFQNCIELLLGKDTFIRELAGGAFFLLEDWAQRFDSVVGPVFNYHAETMKEIFHEGHTRLLCLRTPCSSDFAAAAENVAAQLKMPIEWRDVTLDEMENTMRPFFEKPTLESFRDG